MLNYIHYQFFCNISTIWWSRTIHIIQSNLD